MNSKDKNSMEGLETHIMYIRQSIDEIKQITKQQDDKINNNQSDIRSMKVLGTVAISLLSILVAVLNILF